MAKPCYALAFEDSLNRYLYFPPSKQLEKSQQKSRPTMKRLKSVQKMWSDHYVRYSREDVINLVGSQQLFTDL